MAQKRVNNNFLKWLHLPQKLYQWTILFYSGILLVFLISFLSPFIWSDFWFELLKETTLVMSLVLFLFAVIFLIKIPFTIINFYRNRQNSTLRNAFLFLITIPIVLGITYFIGSAIIKTTITTWQDVAYKKLPYQKLENFPPLYCGQINYYAGDNFHTFAIMNEQEYKLFRNKFLNRADESPKLSNRCSQYNFPDNFPEINFDKNILLIRTIPHGDCDMITNKVYQDDITKRILYISNATTDDSKTGYAKHGNIKMRGVCTLRLNYQTDAIVVPKLPGYKLELKVNDSTHRFDSLL